MYIRRLWNKDGHLKIVVVMLQCVLPSAGVRTASIFAVVKRVITLSGVHRAAIFTRGGQDLIVIKTSMNVRMRCSAVVQTPTAKIPTDHTFVIVTLGISDFPTGVSVSIKIREHT